MYFLAAGEQVADGTPTGLIITGVTAIVVAVVGFFTARFAARQSTKVSESADSAAAKNADVAGWRNLIESLQGEVKRVQSRQDDLDTQAEGYRGRIDALEVEVRSREVKYRVSLSYIHELTQWVKETFGIEKPLPPVPHELADDVKI